MNDKEYRHGPPSDDEIIRVRGYIGKENQILTDKLNEVLREYGFYIHDYQLMFDDSRPYPIFEGDPEKTMAQKFQGVLAKGAQGIKEELDKYVVQQDKAKKILAVEIINHYRRKASKSREVKRKKKNTLLVGSTGVGKTYLIERIAELLKVPFAKVDASDYTTAGYVGGDVDDIIRRNLLRNAKVPWP